MSDGYCVQNGVDNTGSGTKTITLSQPYIASNYVVLLTGHNTTNAYTAAVSGRFTDYFNVYKANTQCYWETKGYIR